MAESKPVKAIDYRKKAKMRSIGHAPRKYRCDRNDQSSVRSTIGTGPELKDRLREPSNMISSSRSRFS